MNCPTPNDTTPGNGGGHDAKTSIPSLHCARPPRMEPGAARPSSWEASEPKPRTHSKMGGAGYRGTPLHCVPPSCSQSLTRMGHGDMQGCGITQWTPSSGFPSLVFPWSSKALPSVPGRKGLEQDWGETQLVWSKLGPGVGMNSALGTGTSFILQGWDACPKFRVWELGWSPKWGFCSQKEFPSPLTGWNSVRGVRSGVIPFTIRSWIRLSASCLNSPPAWGHGGDTEHPESPCKPPHPSHLWGGSCSKLAILTLL